MADHGLSHVKLWWAKVFQPFIIWECVEHLFRAFEAKEHLNHDCPSILVRTRFPHFLKLCYALDRSPCHGHFELWSTENGSVFWKKCWVEIWWFKLVLYDACYVARFHVNGCWIHDVCCLLFLLICWFAISGKLFFTILWWRWRCYSKP